MSGKQPKIILILAANPKDSVPLRLDEEVREIKAGLQRSRHRERFVVEYESAARPRDVRRAMLDYKPQIVHFCGHGAGENGLVLEDETGKSKLVSTEALASLFELFSDQVECVLLNACFSELQARAIAQHIDAVIGMNQAIGDRAAIEFAVSFYDALGAGEDVAFAFRLGCNAMQLAGIAEDQTPVLFSEVAAAAPPAEDRPRLFISYKRGVEPDEPVALEIFQALSQDYEVFIDQTMTVGTRWAERIEAEIRQSDFLITFLSAHSVHSEMVLGEIETAHHLSQEQGKPTILPIRLAYRDPFVYPLGAYLNEINWAFWDSPGDTPRLLEELRQAIAGNPLSIATAQAKTDLTNSAAQSSSPIPQPLPAAQPVSLKLPLEMPEGTMDRSSQLKRCDLPLEGLTDGLPFQGHTSYVLSVAFSPDVQTIASGSADKTVRLWLGDWEGWLQSACNRLRFHPALQNPEDSTEPAVAKAAKQTCEQQVWGKLNFGAR